MNPSAKTVILAGVLFGLPVGLCLSLVFGVFIGAIVGLVSGTFFGMGAALFAQQQGTMLVQQAPEMDVQDLLRHGPANHLLNGEGVGGWLFLTEQRLVFRSHGFNIQVHELFIPLSEVLEVQACRTAWVLPNGLIVMTEHGEKRFVVEDHGTWAKQIREACALLPSNST
jgi:hypothetical protein